MLLTKGGVLFVPQSQYLIVKKKQISINMSYMKKLNYRKLL